MKMPGKCHRTKIPVKKFGKNGEDDIWEVMTWSEGWTGREKSCFGAESVRDTRGKECDRN